jgi:20S proteasome alpha/beta subunit
VTVCIAALFNWNYGTRENPDWQRAAIVASDRMITAGDIEYEPQQLKLAFITPRTVIMIAGDYSIHSQAMKDTNRELQGHQNQSPQNIALIYGRAIQAIKRQQAEDLYLAPLGMNTDTFLGQQKDLSESFVHRIADQLQNYRGDDVEALVVGSDGNIAHLYSVDLLGTVSCRDDVGFGAIGIGAMHANSRFMQAGYTNRLPLAGSLATVYAAKVSAEIAPGVGTATDIHLVFKDAVVPLVPDLHKKLKDLFDEYQRKHFELQIAGIKALDDFIVATPVPGDKKPVASEEKVSDGNGAPRDDHTAPNAAAEPHKQNETQPAKGQDGEEVEEIEAAPIDL